jgi:hypothetical protein
MSPHGLSEPGPDATLAPLDVLLGQGEPAELAAFRARMARDPAAMLAMAETVDWVDTLRSVRCTPSPMFAARLHDVVQRAERRWRTPPPAPWAGLWLAAAAALLGWLGLCWLDPLGRLTAARQRGTVPVAAAGATQVADPATGAADGAVAGGSALPRLYGQAEVAWESAVERMRSRLDLEPSTHLRAALEVGLQPSEDPLGQWLDPRNALVWLRLEHELRSQASWREGQLQQRGSLAAIDTRVQQLADAVAADLPQAATGAPTVAAVRDVAYALRALIAAGTASPGRHAALAAGSDWLVAHLPELSGGRLVTALAGLLEVAAVSDRHLATLGEHGARLVAEVLDADEQQWRGRLPELVGSHAEARVLGEAGRLLARLPGIGLPAARCHLVRQLLLGQLRSRRAQGADGPEALAALLFGYADLLASAERGPLELQLRRWKPARLAPDFATAHQLTAGVTPGRPGFRRMQGELRQLAVLPTPQSMGAQAMFCLCLAPDFAALAGADDRVVRPPS